MAIDFGQKEKKQQVDQALEILQKWSGPIYEQAAKRGFGGVTTTKTHDPSITAKLMQEIPSQAEAIMGGIQGAVSGFMAGGSFAGGMKPGDDKALAIGRMLGATAGAYAGSATYGNREAGQYTGAALNNIAMQAAEWEKQTKQKIAQDAITSMGQKMALLNNPQTPEQAIQYAQELDKLVATTAQNLYNAGVAPDKAIQVAESMASINSPGSRYSPIGDRVNIATQEYEASGKTPEDKAKLSEKIRGLVMEVRVARGELPVDMEKVAVSHAKAQAATQQMAGSAIAGKAPAQPAQPAAAPSIQATKGVPPYLSPNAPPQAPVNIMEQVTPNFNGNILPLPPPGPALDPHIEWLKQNFPELNVESKELPQDPHFKWMEENGLLPSDAKAAKKAASTILPESMPLTDKIATHSPELAKRNEVVSNELHAAIDKINTSGITDDKVEKVVANLKRVDEYSDKMLDVIASNKMPDSSKKEVWGSELYLDGLSPGMAKAAGAAVGAGTGAAAGAYLGAHAGPAAPAAIPITSKSLAAAGAATGATLGKSIGEGFTGIGKGKGMFLEESDKKALGDINTYFGLATKAMSKIIDPDSQVTDKEGVQFDYAKPKPIKGPELNMNDILTFKEAALAEAIITISNQAARAKGKEKENLLKMAQELRLEALKKGMGIRMEEAAKARAERNKAFSFF